MMVKPYKCTTLSSGESSDERGERGGGGGRGREIECVFVRACVCLCAERVNM